MSCLLSGTTPPLPAMMRSVFGRDIPVIELMLIWGKLPWGRSRCPRKTGSQLGDHRWPTNGFDRLLGGDDVSCNCGGITVRYTIEPC